MLQIKTKVSVLACSAGVLCATMAQAELVSVTPSRPSVSSSAQLSAPGYFELESGYLRVKGSDDATRTSFPTRLKYAFNEHFGLLLDHEAAVRERGADGKVQGAGDTALLAKFKLPTEADASSALGLEAGVIAPTARDGLGAGKPAYLVNGIYSAELADFSLDINLGATRLNSVEEGEGRTGWNWAAAASYGVTERLGVIGEFSGSGRRGTDAQSQFLTVLTYNVSRKFVLDAGMAWGINKAAPDRMAFAGFALLLDTH